MPRSLKDPVGLRPSYLKNSLFRPRAGPRFWLRTSGVDPSDRSSIGVASLTGSHSRYLAMTPTIDPATRSQHPQKRVDGDDYSKLRDAGPGAPQRRVGGGVGRHHEFRRDVIRLLLGGAGDADAF